MRHFVADHGTDRAVVHGIIRVCIEERRLQNASRKNDFVTVRLIIRVHCRRRHAPVCGIDRLADLVQLARGRKLCGADVI